MAEFTGIIAKAPVIREKVIYSALSLARNANPIQLVCFPGRAKIAAKVLSGVKINDQVTITGVKQRSPYTAEEQIVLTQVKPEQAINHTDDAEHMTKWHPTHPVVANDFVWSTCSDTECPYHVPAVF